jgi:hypothetical protein
MVGIPLVWAARLVSAFENGGVFCGDAGVHDYEQAGATIVL